MLYRSKITPTFQNQQKPNESKENNMNSENNLYTYNNHCQHHICTEVKVGEKILKHWMKVINQRPT